MPTSETHEFKKQQSSCLRNLTKKKKKLCDDKRDGIVAVGGRGDKNRFGFYAEIRCSAIGTKVEEITERRMGIAAYLRTYVYHACVILVRVPRGGRARRGIRSTLDLSII